MMPQPSYWWRAYLFGLIPICPKMNADHAIIADPRRARRSLRPWIRWACTIRLGPDAKHATEEER